MQWSIRYPYLGLPSDCAKVAAHDCFGKRNLNWNAALLALFNVLGEQGLTLRYVPYEIQTNCILKFFLGESVQWPAP